MVFKRTLIPFPSKSNKDKVPPNLYSLTKNVQTLLPRELRDIICTYILSTPDIEQIAQCASPRLDRFPYTPGKEPADYLTHPSDPAPNLPPFADKKSAYEGFVKEILSMVYELHPQMWIDYPSAISTFLETDFWGVGEVPRDSRLNVVHVSGLLEAGYHNSINLSSLAEDLDLLLECKKQRHLNLDIVFRSELGVSIFAREQIPVLAQTMYAVWQIMRDFINKAEDKGVSVAFLILTIRKMYVMGTSAGVGDCGSNNAGFDTEEEWKADLDYLLAHLCYMGRWDGTWEGFGRADGTRCVGGWRARGVRFGTWEKCRKAVVRICSLRPADFSKKARYM